MIKNDPQKKKIIVQMLKVDRHVADLYQMATKVLIDLSLFSFDAVIQSRSITHGNKNKHFFSIAGYHGLCKINKLDFDRFCRRDPTLCDVQ